MKLTWVEYQIQLTLKSEGRDFPGSQSQDRTQREGCCIGLYQHQRVLPLGHL